MEKGTPPEQDLLGERLRNALSSSYSVERQIGRGGMATVYLARDLRHQRSVALKVLDPALGAALGAPRFRREITLAAALQHPHIVPVFDSGETADGDLWFTMPFIAGESLRERMRRDGRLPVPVVLAIAREVASALECAHRKGTIHRDVKPENVLLSEDGQALVADFGIARGATGSSEDRLTLTGLSVGTPTYMSPEQITAGSVIDGRSDQYALGCLVYEMLAGRPPYEGQSVQSVIAQQMAAPIPLVRAVRPDATAELEAAVVRAMSKEPDDRFGSTAEFAVALGSQQVAPAATSNAGVGSARTGLGADRASTKLTAAGLALAVLAAGGAWWAAHRSAGGGLTVSPTAGPLVVAVLPFENRGTAAEAYFSTQLAAAVRRRLTGLPALRVIASTSSEQSAASGQTPMALAQELGANYLVAGRVLRTVGTDGEPRGDLAIALIRGDDGDTVYRAAMPDSSLPAAPGQAAERIAAQLGRRLRPADVSQLRRLETPSARAYDSFFRAEARAAATTSVNLSRPSLEALRDYEAAIALDSSFAFAWAEMSLARTSAFFLGEEVAADRKRALAAAQRSIALDPESLQGYLALGTYYIDVEKQPDLAARQLAIARRLAPNDSRTLEALAGVEAARNNDAVAIALYQQVLAVDPFNRSASFTLALMLNVAHRFDEAAAIGERALHFAPDDFEFWRLRLWSAIGRGDSTEMRTIVRRAARAVDPTTLVVLLAGYGQQWTLDTAQRQLLLRQRPSAFEGDRTQWALALGTMSWMIGDSIRARAYGDSAMPSIRADLRDSASFSTGLGYVGVAMVAALRGRRAESEKYASRAETLSPLEGDISGRGPSVQDWLINADAFLGDRESILRRLEQLRESGNPVSAGELRLNPIYRSLRGDPRFERIITEARAASQ